MGWLPHDARAERGVDPDRELVVACLEAGDSTGWEPFRILHERHRARVHRICLRITGNASDALDATQEAFLLALRGLGRFRGQARFSRWLYRIAARASIEHLRRRHAGPGPSESLDASQLACPRPDPLLSAERREERVKVRGTLRRLPAPLREVLVLRYFEGLSYEEIQHTLDIAGGSVRSRLHRAHHAGVWQDRFPRERSTAEPEPGGVPARAG